MEIVLRLLVTRTRSSHGVLAFGGGNRHRRSTFAKFNQRFRRNFLKGLLRLGLQVATDDSV
ncbi:hypothetical protein HanHA300_Chr10g0356551 [Helianthus annuus]|nr:hypothetical protein HanHA300_Chr10g0356551 [Helianthus annuus]KAJ0529458.1 hypothetical protein HanHA89_Chr10g0378161 [Helianthus annuus]